MEFDYYYGSQADQFSFIRIPRMLLTEDTFASLTLQSKMLYAAGHAESGLYEIATYKNGGFGKTIKYYLVETKTLDGWNGFEKHFQSIGLCRRLR